VTGTPGTGKTIFSTTLAKQTGAQCLSLGEYVVEHQLFKGIDRKRKTKIVDVPKARSHLKRFISKHDLLIVDSHIPEGIVPNDATIIVFVLRCNPRILESRLSRRRWSREKVRENVIAEMVDSCFIAALSNYDRRKVLQLDTSHRNVKRSVLLARKILLNPKSYKDSSIDWLAKMGKDKSFLKLLGW
jgi:adenylate kinase